jgi:hypothetical protein
MEDLNICSFCQSTTMYTRSKVAHMYMIGSRSGEAEGRKAPCGRTRGGGVMKVIFTYLTEASLGHGRAAGVNEDTYAWLRDARECKVWDWWEKRRNQKTTRTWATSFALRSSLALDGNKRGLGISLYIRFRREGGGSIDQYVKMD